MPDASLEYQAEKNFSKQKFGKQCCDSGGYIALAFGDVHAQKFKVSQSQRAVSHLCSTRFITCEHIKKCARTSSPIATPFPSEREPLKV